MYTTSEKQITAVEAWIKSLPDSTVKGKYEVWLEEVKKKKGIKTEELEKFVSMAGSLTAEFQNYPQEFALLIKNNLNPETKEQIKEETKEVANVIKVVQPKIVPQKFKKSGKK